MPLNIGTDENPVEVFVADSSGYIDALVRAPNQTVFETAARAVDLYYEVTETIVDPDTGEETQQGTGEWVLSPGVHIDPINAVIVTPAVLDQDGEIITPAVLDPRYHANIRLSSPATEKLDDNGNVKWQSWATQWTQNGIVDNSTNASEQARILMSVALIDPDSINTKQRVWL